MKNELYPFPFPPDLFVRDPSNQPFPIPSLNVVYLRRNFLGRVVNVGITPTLIHRALYPQNIMITNPARGPGGGATRTGLVTQQIGVVAAGNSEAAPIGVSNYMDMHLMLNVTAITAGTSWTIVNVIQDPITLNWVDSQVLITGVTPALVGGWTNASFYGNIGMFGVGTQFAVRWTSDAGAGAISFTISYVLKDGMIGSDSGVSQVIYIGPDSGVTMISGYPIFENMEKVFQVGEGVDIWGIAAVATNINVFEL
jgi:hypothetical protein